MSPQPVKIFIASSGDLAGERQFLENILTKLNRSPNYHHLDLQPIKWEHDLESGSQPAPIQDVINPMLDEADIVFFLFYSRLGIYTREEFDRARAKGKKAFFYFKKFQTGDPQAFEQYLPVCDLKASLQKESANTLTFDFDTIPELDSQIRQDLDLYLPKKFPQPSGLTFPSTPPDPLADWPLPDDIGFPEHPFLGFHRFERQDARIFFGRSAEIKDILDKLEQSPHKILLLYGQSGAGKSSLLEAGLLPRLQARGWEVAMRRRNRDKGLTADFAEAWREIQSSSTPPRLLLLDQVEEMITNPNADRPTEKDEWAVSVRDLWDKKTPLIISFRKEYLPEIRDLLVNRHGLDCQHYYLKPLGSQGIRDAVLGNMDRNDKYLLKNLDTLAEKITADLTGDEYDAPHTAPLLQITLRKMWDDHRASRLPFDLSLYRRIKKDTLPDMLDQQLLELEAEHAAPYPELQNAIRQGLALDLLRQFVTEELTATSRSLAHMKNTCYPHVPFFDTLVLLLKKVFLLTEEPGQEDTNTRLVHDALAPLVINRCNTSVRPAQIAWSIFEAKKRLLQPDSEEEISQSDLKRLEEGIPYMESLPVAFIQLMNLNRAIWDSQKTAMVEKTVFQYDTLLKSAREKIESVNHTEAIPLLKAACFAEGIDHTHKANTLKNLLLDQAFFLSATNRFPKETMEALSLLRPFAPDMPLLEDPSRKTVHGAFQSYLPPQTFDELRHRYYPRMIEVAGCDFFEMGGEMYADEKPIHRVALSDFALAQTPVTFSQFGLYAACRDKSLNAYTPGWGRQGDHPVVFITWYDAVEYLDWINEYLGLEKTFDLDRNEQEDEKINQNKNDYIKWKVRRIPGAKGYGLPTEAQWEYAARGGGQWTDRFEYAGGNDLDQLGWYWLNSGKARPDGDWSQQKVNDNDCRTHPVIDSSKLPNQLGLHGMSGNVWEWCWDWMGDYPPDSAKIPIDPVGPEAGSDRVLRGGSWGHHPRYCRVAYRVGDTPDSRSNDVGFRPSRTI